MAQQRILIVDDSTQMRDFMAGILRTEGYTVDTARDGVEALASALAHPPGLIVTDHSMPEMSGLELAQALREASLEVPIILITAEGSEDIAVQALRLGVMDYFVKPFDPMALLDAVDRILGAARIGAVRMGVPDQRRLRTLNILMAIGKSLTALHDMDTVLDRVVEAAIYLVQATEGALMLLDDAAQELYVRASRNLLPELATARLPVADSLAGPVVQNGQVALYNGNALRRAWPGSPVRSLLIVPLKFKGRGMGVLSVYHREAEGAFSQEDAALLAALADYAAIVIANARLYTEAEGDRARLSRIFDQVEDGILALDADSRVVLCNPIARNLLEAASGEPVVGRSLAELTANRSLLDVAEWPSEAGSRQAEVELADGRVFNVQVSDISDLGRVLVLRDITYLKERDRAKTALAGAISRQVRTPLTTILAHLEMLQAGEAQDDGQGDKLASIRQSILAIDEAVRDLMDFARLEASLDRTRDLLDLSEVAQDAVDVLRARAAARGQSIELDVPQMLPPILGDRVRLRQLFLALLEQGLEHTPEGGTVRVRIVPEAGQLVASVQDPGKGLSADERAEIVDRFYQTGRQGAPPARGAFSLRPVQAALESHGGRLWVDSQPGAGTTFTVVLPAFDITMDRLDGVAW